MKEKKKILVIADSPMVPSGVGIQTRYMIEALLNTGEYRFLCLAGAIKHADYSTKAVAPWGEDWLIRPVNGYGDKNTVRRLIREYRPDVLWFMTDPRFYVWLWEMENEIRPNVPMIYYHVWDNHPAPKFNKSFYESNDLVCTISKLTDQVVREVAPNTMIKRIPHTVDTNVFQNSKESQKVKDFRNLITGNKEKMVFFWNNRNARRKQSGTLIFWFKEFLDKIGHEKACLVMHTEPKDPHGQDLKKIVDDLGLKNNQVLFSIQKLSPEDLSHVYSSVDCTINISDAEGFGLSTLESLSCEVPIIVNMTGGLQEQVTDGVNWFGFGINPSSRCIIGSQDVPYIYEDRINKEEFIDTLVRFFNTSKEEREQMGSNGRQHVLNNYGFEQYAKMWVDTIKEVETKFGSWDTRKEYCSWSFGEIE